MHEPRNQSLKPCSPSALHGVCDPSWRFNNLHIYKRRVCRLPTSLLSRAVVVRGPQEDELCPGAAERSPRRPYLLYMFQKSCRLAWFTTFPICCR